ncbi:MAG TPA: RagB/SusD family nutrient uptake outer membrane protein [Chitinophaga sp.]
MKKLHLLFLTIAIAAGAGSCKKYLDIKPKGVFVPQAISDYRLLLDATSSNQKSAGFFNTFSNDVLYSDDMTFNPFSVTMADAHALNAYRFLPDIYLESESDPDWDAMYNQIYTCNIVIGQVMNATGGTLPEKQKLLAEARVHRAFAYFTLVNLYAKQYTPASAGTDPGVPLRVTTDFEEKLPRRSVQEVYDYLVNDLQAAVPYLPATPDATATNRPVQPTAYTLLARAALFMGQYEQAHAYADSALQDYSTLADFNTLPPNPAFPSALVYPINFKNPETLMEITTISPISLFYASNELLAAFPDNNDLRKTTFFIADNQLGLNFGSISMEWFGRQPTKGPSVPEAYLVRAESSARLGNAADAVADLNLLRSKRFRTGSSYQVSAPNAAAALALVKAERRRELAFRGFRFFDVKRYNAYDGDNINIMHTDPEGTYTLAANSNGFALPIGRQYIQLNPEITQNPR